MAKHVTLRQISEKVGVSSVAVGAALGLLSAKSRVGVSAEKAKEIRRIAAEMGFEPNNLARAFHKQSAQTVGVLFRVLSNPTLVNHLLDDIHRQLETHGYRTNLRPFGGKVQRLEATVNDLIAWRVDGLIFINLFKSDEADVGWERVNQRLDALEIPFVTIESTVTCTTPRVCFRIDHGKAFYDLTQHLLDLGHRRIVTLGDLQFTKGDRWAGVQHAVGLTAGASVEHVEIPVLVTDNPIHSQVLSIRAMAEKIAKMDPRPTAVVCGNDIIAAALCGALRGLEIRVPDDISITGYDNSELALINNPELTTVSWSTSQLATASIGQLLSRIQQKPVDPKTSLKQNADEEPQPADLVSIGFQQSFPGQLIVRHSTASPAKKA